MSGLDDKVRSALGRILENTELADWIGGLIDRLVYEPIVRPALKNGVVDSIVRPGGHPLVAGVYETERAVVDAVGALREAGHSRLVVYSPAPSHHIEEAMAAGPSIIRFFTFAGAVLGGAGGFTLAALTSLDWNLIVAGKPVVSIPAYLVITFESAILIGAIFTLLGFLLSARLPQPELNEVFDGRFSDDRYGIGIVCREEDVEDAGKALTDSGATEAWRA